jgi:hypothetical protein
VAGVDLGVIHPFAVAGPDGNGLLVSGRECVRYFVRGIFPRPVPDAYPVFLNRAIWSSSARFIRGLC